MTPEETDSLAFAARRMEEAFATSSRLSRELAEARARIAELEAEVAKYEPRPEAVAALAAFLGDGPVRSPACGATGPGSVRCEREQGHPDLHEGPGQVWPPSSPKLPTLPATCEECEYMGIRGCRHPSAPRYGEENGEFEWGGGAPPSWCPKREDQR